MKWTFPRHLAPSGSASSAICRCFVGTPIFGSVSAHLMCPTHSFLCPTSPFPTRWLPWVGSPLFRRYYEDAKTAGCSSSRSSFSFERGLPPGLQFLLLASGFWSPSRCAWALVYRSRHTTSGSFSFWRKPVGSLMFPGNPLCVCPALRPRSDLRAKPVVALRFCPRGQDYEGSSVDHYFEALSHGFRTAPYASCRHRGRLRNVRFRLVASLCRVGIVSPLDPCIVFPSLVFFPFTSSSSHSGFS